MCRRGESASLFCVSSNSLRLDEWIQVRSVGRLLAVTLPKCFLLCCFNNCCCVRLVLSPCTMGGFFRPSLGSIISTATTMLARCGGAVDVIVLVGGFSASKFVRRELAAALEAGGGPPVVAPDYGATAVLEGEWPGQVLRFELLAVCLHVRLSHVVTVGKCDSCSHMHAHHTDGVC